MRRLAAALLVAAGASLATTAHAQLADLQNQAGEAAGVDSDLTPVATPSNLWEQVGGSFYRSGGKIDDLTQDSATSYDEDLFAVGFRDLVTPGEDYGDEEVAIRAQEQGQGFAGGARCIREDPSQPIEPAEVEGCERVPVIYRYPEQEGLDRWAESYVSPTSRPGYVGAVAWIDESRAIAVGGNGTYPRREHERRLGESYEDWVDRNPAGRARVWLYEDQSWRELTNKPDPEGGFTGEDGDEIPDDMRGLTAVDCSPREVGFCAAGGLGQMWHFEGGVIDPEPITEPEVEKENPRSPEFLFRVRAIAFASGKEESPAGGAAAVTAGCCAAGGSSGTPAKLIYADGGWTVSAPTEPTELIGTTPSGKAWKASSLLADSMLSVAFAPAGYNRSDGWSEVLAPGGPESAGESGSWVIPDAYGYDPPEIPARLLSGDGDYLGYCSSAPSPAVPAPCSRETSVDYYYGPNGVMDWAVGGLRSRQGGAYTTAPFKSRSQPHWVAPTLPAPRPDENTEPDSYAKTLANQQLFKLPSYRLNSIDVVAPQRGWAAGDHGALVRLGSASGSSAEPDPPKLGNGKAAELSEDSAYEAIAPGVAEKAGPLPALATQETEQLPEPRLVPYGTPAHDRQIPTDKVNAIVMSRDGSEGWALGGDAGHPGRPDDWALTLYRWDGEAWTRCETDGISGEVPPDPACEALAPLRHYQPSADGIEHPVRITAAAQVPLEYDDDPTNDDEFEAIAVGTGYRLKPGEKELGTILRYSDGRWTIDKHAMRQIAEDRYELSDVAFTGPGDGWLAARGPARLWHFEDDDPADSVAGTWTKCGGPGADGCDDAEGRIPPANDNGRIERWGGGGASTRGIHFAIAGERIYMYGTRAYANEDTNDIFLVGSLVEAPPDPYPMIIYRDPDGQWTSKGGGYDPGFDEAEPDPEKSGRVGSLAVVQPREGSFVGWATGSFGKQPPRPRSPAGLPRHHRPSAPGSLALRARRCPRRRFGSKARSGALGARATRSTTTASTGRKWPFPIPRS